MGHTVWSGRQNADIILKELEHYAKALRPNERQLYLKLLKEPLKHIGAITYTSSMHEWAFLLLSIIVEQQKQLEEFNARLAHGLIPQQEPNHLVDKDT